MTGEEGGGVGGGGRREEEGGGGGGGRGEEEEEGGREGGGGRRREEEGRRRRREEEVGEEGGRRRREEEGVEDEEEKEEVKWLRKMSVRNRGWFAIRTTQRITTLRDNYNFKFKIQFRETFYCKGLIFIYKNQAQKPVRQDTPVRDRSPQDTPARHPSQGQKSVRQDTLTPQRVCQPVAPDTA